jgi:hypothetical protein
MTRKQTILKFCLPSLVALIAIVVGCRYDCQTPGQDVVDYIIQGNARLATKHFSFPTTLNPIWPVIRIETERDFVKWFPVIFDKEARRELAEKKRITKNGGWDFQNWQGESFSGGLLWRGCWDEDRKVHCINIFSASLFDKWEAAYKKDLMTLAPKYRRGCTWAAYYFVSEDSAYFGRVDSMSRPWKRNDREDCTKVGDKFRVMLFRRGQRTSDEPWKVFNYDGKRKGEDESERDWTFADGIHSVNEDFKFDYYCVRHEEMAEMYLEFGGKSGKETVLRLKSSDWPPPNARR